MGTPFIAEVRIVSFNFAPRGWAMCSGQLLPINQNQALFSLLGTMYGGNGQTTFALPDLRGRVPVHVGAGFVQGQKAGEEAHTLISSEMPAHPHSVSASSGAPNQGSPAGNEWAALNNGYSTGTPNTALDVSAIGVGGGSQSHENRQPYLVLNFVIALQGIFPSRN
jgi:microcystin-dependent protein